MKRITLFLIVNFLVVTTLSFLLHLFQVGQVGSFFGPQGLHLNSLMIFCMVWGMGGALISLAISRKMAKWTAGVRLIGGPAGPLTQNLSEAQLVQTVHRLAAQAGITIMPEVGIYESPEVNAFATGPTRNRSLVAVSSGLLNQMTPTEVEGVLGHEVAHIANGDMVTMTLIQGVVNAFVMFLARAIAYAIVSGGRREEGGRGMTSSVVFYIVQMALEMVFMILGSIVVAAFSRHREFRADAGGAKLAGSATMISSLEALRKMIELSDLPAEGATSTQPIGATLKISSRPRGFFQLFATHPKLEDRINRLRNPG